MSDRTPYIYNEKQHKTLLDLMDSISNGARPIVVINDEIFPDSYLEKGMKAMIIGMEVDETAPADDHDDVVVHFILDFSSFDDFNINLESPAYLNEKDQTYSLTATESDNKPKDLREDVYHSINYGKIFFDLSENDKSTKLISKYKESKFNGSYVEWLENQIDL